jgi:hypothetical protein
MVGNEKVPTEEMDFYEKVEFIYNVNVDYVPTTYKYR